MMKKLLVLSCLLCGCFGPGSKPSEPAGKPLEGAKMVAGEMAAQKVAIETTVLHATYKNAVFELVESGRFGEVETLFHQLEKRDAIETLCTPCSLAFELGEMQEVWFDYPWPIYYGDFWQNATHSGYANMASASAFYKLGESLMAACHGSHLPLWYEGKFFCDKAIQSAAKVQKGQAGWPYCEMLTKISRSGKERAILSEIHEYPQEIALYLFLSDYFKDLDRKGKARLLKGLVADSPSHYALFFTLYLQKAGSRRVSIDGWEWETLQKGFEQLLTEHPQALGVRNAYAVAAEVLEKKEVLELQASKLGYLWDEGYWGSLGNYQRSLNSSKDYHLAPSEFSPLRLDDFFRLNRFEHGTRLQSRSLLHHELWTSLEAYLSSLVGADQIMEAEESLQEPLVETTASYEAREKLLQKWRQATESPASRAALGGFYINYGWLARGKGTADTVSSEGWTKFKKRLKAARNLLYPVFGNGYHSESTMANLMILYNAESANLASAKKLAVTAARTGRTGNAAIRSYAQMLLPRWQGEPGDMAAAADMLRKETGNDDCYALMTGVAIRAEGLECLQPGHPVAMDWKRAVNSVVAAGRANRLSRGTARKFLHFCAMQDRRQDAARILPFVPLSYPALTDWPPVLLMMERQWANGRVPSIIKESKLTFTSNGPRRQKVGPKLNVGFTVHFDPPEPLGDFFIYEIVGPPTDYEGTPFQEYILVETTYPAEAHKLVVAPQRNADGLLKPGTYTVRLRRGGNQGTPVHEETFEVLP